MTGAGLFDLDGTLVDTERRSRAVWAKLLRAHGVASDDAVLDGFVGRRGYDVLVEMAHLFPGHTLDDLYEEVLSYTAAPDLPPTASVPGAVELVRHLAAGGVPMAVVTSGMRWYAEGNLDALGIADLFTTLVTGDDVVNGKPDPEGFAAARSALGVPAGHAVAFEDSPFGVRAAQAAGIRCIGVATTHSPRVLAAADLVVTDLTEVSWPVRFPADEPRKRDEQNEQNEQNERGRHTWPNVE